MTRLHEKFVLRNGTRTEVFYTSVRVCPCIYLRHDPTLKRIVHVSPWRDRVTSKRNDKVVIYWRWPWPRDR